MPKSFNVGDLSKKFKQIINKKIFADVAFLTANQIKAKVAFRVFGAGKLTSEKKSGKYISSWKNARKKKGRQIIYKDFDMNGDLRNSFKLLKNKQGIAEVGFNNTKEAAIADGQDKQMRRIRGESGKTNVIFSASEKEIKEATKLATAKIVDIVSKQIKSIF